MHLVVSHVAEDDGLAPKAEELEALAPDAVDEEDGEDVACWLFGGVSTIACQSSHNLTIKPILQTTPKRTGQRHELNEKVGNREALDPRTKAHGTYDVGREERVAVEQLCVLMDWIA